MVLGTKPDWVRGEDEVFDAQTRTEQSLGGLRYLVGAGVPESDNYVESDNLFNAVFSSMPFFFFFSPLFPSILTLPFPSFFFFFLPSLVVPLFTIPLSPFLHQIPLGLV